MRWGSGVGLGLHIGFTCVAFLCTGFRAIVLLGSRSQNETNTAAPDDGEPTTFPVYSVLIALHREADMAEPLVHAMAMLDWPTSRLEVFFVCEATDPDTIAAIERAIAPYPHFSVVVTPASQPTTKPKALNFALPLTRGEFVVLYDAEDIPRPDQLRDAWATFRRSNDTLACLQAPLVVTNGDSGWRQAHYAMEYAVLFRMLLPWLAARGLPLPLGGTSNHFRRDHLVSAGGWDSHNVAEDADLGIRLARLGLTTGTISSPTLETSTVRWPDWRNQRTRWIKGWIQTWLVHMRDPVLTTRQLGLGGMVAFQIVFLGMVASSFAHIALLTQLAGFAVYGGLLEAMPSHGWLYAIDAVNLVFACLVFSASFLRVASPNEQRLASKLWGLWAYWALVSYAGIRAIWQLWRSPHLWEKTPHSSFGAVPALSGPADKPISFS
nr:glycosyltransferase [Aureimonas jatrophae]